MMEEPYLSVFALFCVMLIGLSPSLHRLTDGAKAWQQAQ
jgi:hypothetical protein